MDIERIGRICHEANRALCEAYGDSSQVPWAEAPDWQHESTFQGIEFLQNNLQAGDGDLHEAWRQHKMTQGWVWGAVKNPERLEHPCMVPFHELSPTQQAKDRLFRAIVKALL